MQINNHSQGLNYFGKKLSADMVVCEVSSNYMSVRDAEERIAAHYAGKQYIGWKVVRDKLKELRGKYGNTAGGDIRVLQGRLAPKEYVANERAVRTKARSEATSIESLRLALSLRSSGDASAG